MTEFKIFTSALNLQAPWYISKVELKNSDTGEDLHITINHEMNVKFEYEDKHCPVYDHQLRTWRHLNFFQHQCYIHARVPRVMTMDKKVRLIQVPWADSGSSFTLLFELNILELIHLGMSASGAGRKLNIGARRVFNIVNKRVSNALATQPLEDVQALSIDETSSRKGHNYLTVLCDRLKKKVVGISEGKDIKAVENCLLDMEIRGATKQAVKEITMDMSRSYIASAAKYLDQADIVFDRFHIMKKLNEVVDQIRRQEQKQFKLEFKNTRYLWLRNSDKLTLDQSERLNQLSKQFPQIGQTYRLKEMFKEVMDLAYKDSKLKWINLWIKQAKKINIEPLNKFINMLHNHWYGIKGYFKRKSTNAYAERVNLKIQEIKRIAKGYRNIQNFMLMIYFHLGGLKLGLPTKKC
jgi:transposase